MHNYHRAHVLELLAEMLPKHMAHLGKRVTAYRILRDSPGPVEVAFADGSMVTCDLLVGCDGIKSVVRQCMFEGLAANGKPEMKKYIEPVWTGEILYRALIPSEKVPKQPDGRKHSIMGDPIMVRHDSMLCILHCTDIEVYTCSILE